jgi:hypothetical protein
MTEGMSSGKIAAFAAYLLTGFLQPTIIDLIKYHGGTGEPYMVLPTMFNCLGMALVLLIPVEEKSGSVYEYLSLERKLLRPVAICAGVDLFSGALVTIGLLLVGSGMCLYTQ